MVIFQIKNKKPHNYGAFYLVIFILLYFIIFVRFVSTNGKKDYQLC